MYELERVDSPVAECRRRFFVARVVEWGRACLRVGWGLGLWS